MHMTSTSVLGRESKIARSNEENWSKGCSWMMYFHLLGKMRMYPNITFIHSKQIKISSWGCVHVPSFETDHFRQLDVLLSGGLWYAEKLFTQPCFSGTIDNGQWFQFSFWTIEFVFLQRVHSKQTNHCFLMFFSSFLSLALLVSV